MSDMPEFEVSIKARVRWRPGQRSGSMTMKFAGATVYGGEGDEEEIGSVCGGLGGSSEVVIKGLPGEGRPGNASWSVSFATADLWAAANEVVRLAREQLPPLEDEPSAPKEPADHLVGPKPHVELKRPAPTPTAPPEPEYEPPAVEADGDGPTTFYLIRLRHSDDPTWMERGPHPHSGRDAYLFPSGSGFDVLGDEEIVDTVQANDWDELDWARCYASCKGPVGWLDRGGKLWACGPEEHDVFARDVLKMEVRDLERKGWVRIVGEPDSVKAHPYFYMADISMTAEQRRKLVRLGYEVEDV